MTAATTYKQRQARRPGGGPSLRILTCIKCLPPAGSMPAVGDITPVAPFTRCYSMRTL